MDCRFAEMVRLGKENKECMAEIIERMQPLVKTYCRKVFFLDKDDAEQEFVLAIIEAVNNIKECLNDGQCYTYIINAVKFKYISLCKKNIRNV